ncbi:MAG: choice-of-anchor I family protein [Cyanobacteria bacterium P01_G01_bin.39]
MINTEILTDNPSILSGEGAETLIGTDDDDLFISDAEDSIDGGAGIDTVDFSGVTEGSTIGALAGIIADLDITQGGGPEGTLTGEGALLTALPADDGTPIEGLELSNIENIIGSDFDDALLGDNGVNLLASGSGDDQIFGFAADDFLSGGAGTDTVLFSDAPISIFVDLSSQVSEDTFAEIIADKTEAIAATAGPAGEDVLEGFENVTTGFGDDIILGDENDNVLNGAAGADTLTGGGGSDTLIGGDGMDTVDFSASETALSISLAAGAAQTNGATVEFATVGSDTAEIVTFDSVTQQFFVAGGEFIDILNGTGEIVASFPVETEVTSVAVGGGFLAAAIPADPESDAGSVLLFEIADFSAVTPEPIATFEVEALPDSIAFTPDGSQIIVANEGEAVEIDGELVDPEGSISVIDIDTEDPAASEVTTLPFTPFNAETDALIAEGFALLGQSLDDTTTTLAEDIEPEFVAVAPDGLTAFVSLQENSSLAIVDLSGDTPILDSIVPLETVDLSEVPIDANDDGVPSPVTIDNAVALFQPDGIDSFTLDGLTFVATADEGDSRDFDEINLEDVILDPTLFPDAAALQDDETGIGDLEISQVLGDTDGDGDIDELVVFGGRSFSILDDSGSLVFNSEDLIESTLIEQFPLFFNDASSDGNGPEPEAVAVAEIDGETTLFVGLEASAGVLAFDLDLAEGTGVDGVAPEIEVDFAGFVTVPVPGGFPLTEDLDDITAPEGLLLLKSEISPTGEDFIVISDEAQDTTFGFELLLDATSSATLEGIENVVGTSLDDAIAGDDGINLLEGGSGDDTINGLGGADTLIGGDGDDLLISDGADSIEGGAGIDTVDFSGVAEGVTIGAFSGVIVDLDLTKAAGSVGDVTGEGAILTAPPAAGGEPISGLDVDRVENIIGSDFDDGLFGNNDVNIINGGDGSDIIHGFAADDFLSGGAGIDTVLFAAAPESVVVDLSLQVSEDEFSEIVDGTIEASFATSGVTGANVLAGFENVVGGAGDDTLIGDDEDNSLTGSAGDDLLIGGEGADTLTGGTVGLDTLTGGSASDLFILGDEETVFNTTAGDGDFATITDFASGEDQIQLTGTLDDFAFFSVGSVNLIALDDGDGTFDLASDDLVATVINSDFVSGELNTDTDFLFA